MYWITPARARNERVKRRSGGRHRRLTWRDTAKARLRAFGDFIEEVSP